MTVLLHWRGLKWSKIFRFRCKTVLVSVTVNAKLTPVLVPGLSRGVAEMRPLHWADFQMLTVVEQSGSDSFGRRERGGRRRG